MRRAQGKIYLSQPEHTAKFANATRTRKHRNLNGKLSSSSFSERNAGGYKVVPTVSKVNTTRVMTSRPIKSKLCL